MHEDNQRNFRTGQVPPSNYNRNSSNYRPRYSNDSHIKNVNVRRSNVERVSKQSKKINLKKFIAVAGVAVGIGAIITGAVIKNSHKIIKPEDFDIVGKICPASKKLDEDELSSLTLIGCHGWPDGKSEISVENIEKCKEAGADFGVYVDASASDAEDARAAAACVIATVSKSELSTPVYYNVDPISDLPDVLFCEITESFIDELEQHGYEGAIAISDANTLKLSPELNSKDKLIYSYGKEIDYDGVYSACYFERSGECYFNSKVKEEKKDDHVEKGVFQQSYSKGVDVSQHQGNINWKQLKQSGVEYAIIRFSSFYNYHQGEDFNIDKEFFDNVFNCQLNNIPFGIYCFSTATDKKGATKEAEELINVLKRFNIYPDLKVYYDMETDFHFNNPGICTELYKAFSSAVEGQGYECGLYASSSLIRDMCEADSSIKQVPKWVANYTNPGDSVNRPGISDIGEDYLPNNLGDYGIIDVVQVTENGKIDGIESPAIDINIVPKR